MASVTSHLKTEVLLVEDNAGDALLVQQALVDCPVRANVHVARDGEQALQMLHRRDFKPDLVILDLNIPKISGFGVLESYPSRKTPIVVFTVSENKADIDRALQLGALDYVRKPLDLDEYKQAVCGMVQKCRRRLNNG